MKACTEILLKENLKALNLSHLSVDKGLFFKPRAPITMPNTRLTARNPMRATTNSCRAKKTRSTLLWRTITRPWLSSWCTRARLSLSSFLNLSRSALTRASSLLW
jgi:hypothetical protein